MIICKTYDNLAKKYAKSLSVVKDENDVKKQLKQQLMDFIINNPEALKHLKYLEVHECGTIDEEMTKIEITETKKITSYKEMLEEIIKEINKKYEQL